MLISCLQCAGNNIQKSPLQWNLLYKITMVRGTWRTDFQCVYGTHTKSYMVKLFH